MTRFNLLFTFTIIFSLPHICQGQPEESAYNKIQFDISQYNLLFTKVEINNKEYTALIDFGDFAEFQISTELIAELNLKTKKSDIIMSDINGNLYALEKGIIGEIKEKSEEALKGMLLFFLQRTKSKLLAMKSAQIFR